MTYKLYKFRIYPWWKSGRKSEDFLEVHYTDRTKDMYEWAEKLNKDKKTKLKINPKKWFAQVVYHTEKGNKHLKGYVLFCRRSITKPEIVAHELIHVTQFYFGYEVFPLCNTFQNSNHELIAHSHSFMMKRIMKFVKEL